MSAQALDLCLGISLAHARLQLALDDALGTWHGIGHADFILLHALARAEGGCLPTAALVAPLGVPLWCVEAVVDAVLASGKLVAADLAEFNPAFDRDGLTAKVVARLAARLARGA